MKGKTKANIILSLLGLGSGVLLGLAVDYLRPGVTLMINNFDNAMSYHGLSIAIFMIAFDIMLCIDSAKMIHNSQDKMGKLELKVIFMAFFAISLRPPLLAIMGSVFEALFFWCFITFMGFLFVYINNCAKGFIGPFIYRELKGIFKTIRNLIGRSYRRKRHKISREELEQKIRNDIRKISPKTARRIAKDIPEIESMLHGENNLYKP